MKQRSALWWERPRAKGKNGSLVSVKGTQQRILCPSCKEEPVVYNGNYFCDGWGFTCDWALSHPARSKADRQVCELLGLDFE